MLSMNHSSKRGTSETGSIQVCVVSANLDQSCPMSSQIIARGQNFEQNLQILHIPVSNHSSMRGTRETSKNGSIQVCVVPANLD